MKEKGVKQWGKSECTTERALRGTLSSDTSDKTLENKMIAGYQIVINSKLSLLVHG